LLDLEEGVVEEFRVAAEKGLRWTVDEEGSAMRDLRFDSDISRDLYRKTSGAREWYKQRIAAEFRERRALRKQYVITPVEVKKVTCPICGELGEVREGNIQDVFHPGRGVRGTCRQSKQMVPYRIANPWLRGYSPANDNRQSRPERSTDALATLGFKNNAIAELQLGFWPGR
jgi:hypothetical protein